MILRATAYLSALVSLVLINACSSTPINVTPESQHKTKVWILEHNPQVEHPTIDRLFSLLTGRISIGYQNLGVSLPNNLRIYLIENKLDGVFSLCDGTIFVSTGTLRSLNSAHQLITLLAHDIAHIYLEHACTVTSDSDLLTEYEIDADQLAINSLVATHVDPKELESIYLNVYRKSEENDSQKSLNDGNKRLEKLRSNLSEIPEIATKIPEERLFRKVKHLLQR